MSESKMSEFGGNKVEIKKMKLKDANILFPFVGAAMVKMNLGNFNFFNDLKPMDIDILQQKLCENVIVYREKTQDEGIVVTTKRNMSLEDLDDCLEGFLPLLAVFLEFNFGFFSKAQKILEPILTKASESVES